MADETGEMACDEEPLLLSEDFGELEGDTAEKEERPKKPSAVCQKQDSRKDGATDGLKHDTKKSIAAEGKEGVKKRFVGERVKS